MNSERSDRILMLVENNPYPQDTRVLAEATALRDAGYRVTVISPATKGQPWREMLDGVTVYRFPEPPEAAGFWGYLVEYSYATLAIFLLSLLVWARKGIDVIHAANPPDVLVCVAAFYKVFGVRFVFDHHDLSPEMYVANFGGDSMSVTYRALVWFEKLSCRLADHVIATNESYKQIDMERGGVPEDRITIVRNGPDMDLWPPASVAEALAPGTKAVIAYVGSMGIHDGIDYLLRAVHCLVYDLHRKDVECVLIGGKGEFLEKLIRLRDELGLKQYVRFTGWIPEEEKMRLLAGAHICVDPDPSNSFNDRSTMIKIAEYMALCKPIVAFDLPENRYTASEAGLFVTPNDETEMAKALYRLIDDVSCRQAMGAYGRQRVESRLAWSHSVPKLLSAYRALQPSRQQVPLQPPSTQRVSPHKAHE